MENGIITCQEPSISHLDGAGYLFGYPIAHSLSPLLHSTIFQSLGLNYDYFLLPSTDLPQFMRLVRGAKCYGERSQTSHPEPND
jgi:quinate dehydrogenase